MKQPLTLTEDVVSMLLGELAQESYNLLQDEDFTTINEAVAAFGNRYVLVDQIHTINAQEVELLAHSLQVIKFLQPRSFLVLEHNSIGTTTVTCTATADVAAMLTEFVNSSSIISEEQASSVNKLIHSLKQS